MTLRLILTLPFILLSGCQLLTSTSNITPLEPDRSPRNIIMIVADGMGPAYPTAYRLFKDNPDTEIIETTVFDRYLVGMASTYPAQQSGYVTDSAAAATALASGHKSYNGAIGVNVNKEPVESVLTFAKNKGKAIGVAVTSEVNHATPASYLTHNEYRKNYNDIADSYIDDGWKADILLGGGTDYFMRDDRNIVAELQAQGVHYVSDYQQLADLPDAPVFGLFAGSGLPGANSDSDQKRLTTMTKATINYLTKDKRGFFALIEASQVDWAGHSNDIAHAMAEMDDLAQTLIFLEDYVSRHPDTLVVLTADHSTGGVTIAANNKYKWDPRFLRSLQQPLEAIGEAWLNNDLDQRALGEWFGSALSRKQYIQLKAIKKMALAAKKPEKTMIMGLKRFVDNVTNTGWTTGGHTGIDVPVYAFGASAEQFRGHQDNTEIADKIFTLLGR